MQHPDSSPLVSILIVNWNTRALLRACLDSIFATLGAFAYEIIVVDNASSDGSVEWLQNAYPQVRLIANTENEGFARANNQALASSRGKFALLLNSDAQLHTETLAHLVTVLEQESNVAAVAPMLLNSDGTFQAGPNDDLTLWSESLLMFGLARFLRNGFYPGYGAHAPRGEYSWVGGTCMLLRRSTWEQIGMLDTDYFMYTEEADWCWRARQAGWTIWYEPEAQAIHVGGASSRQASARMRATLYKSKLVFFSKHRPHWQTIILRNLLMLTASTKAFGYSIAAHVNSVRAQVWNERALSFRMVVDAVKTIPA